ncbi:flagellar hook-length control protein FliK [Fredinandcohnia humi]
MMGNLDFSQGALGKAVSTRAIVSNGISNREISKGISFREKLDSLIDTEFLLESIDENSSSDMISTIEELISNEDNNKVEESVHFLQKLLSEIEDIKNEKLGSSIEEMNGTLGILLELPIELLNQIKAFLEGFNNGPSPLQVDDLKENSKLLGLLLVLNQQIESEGQTNSQTSTINIEKLQNVIKQLKLLVNETMYQNTSQNTRNILEEQDVKSFRVIADVIRSIENKVGTEDKLLPTLSNRFQYLHAVHSRYFSVPKGMENTNTTISNQLLQKITGTNQATSTNNEVILVNDSLSNQMTKTQQFTLFVEQNAKQLPNQEQFIRQFQNILAKSNFINGTGQQKLLINLYPEHLGSLRIELLQSEGGMIARILASTSQAKELVESQLSNLKQSFAMQNISVEKIEVSNQIQHHSERNSFRDNEQQRQQSQQHQQESNQQDEKGESTFNITLQEELVNLEV